MEFNFDTIRPYRDNEVQEVIAALLSEKELTDLFPVLFQGKDINQLVNYLKSLRTIEDFQVHVVAAWLEELKKVATTGVTMEFAESIVKTEPYIFMSNHRDIILDSAFLQTMLNYYGMMMTEIAIGDNLLKRPWIKQLVRLNRSFIVERDLGVKEQMEVPRG